METNVTDPLRQFHHPANAETLAFLKAQATPRTPANSSPWDIDEYELHTHPDLHERLLQVAEELPERCENAAYGCPILVTPGGVIFAVARGTSLLAFRLPEEVWSMALESGGKPRDDFGKDWMSFDPWDPEIRTRQLVSDLKFWCETAYRCASELS